MNRLRISPVTPAATTTMLIFGTYAAFQGVGLIVDGPVRMANPQFAWLNKAPNPPLFWGLWLIASGGAMLLACRVKNWWLKFGGCVGLGLFSLTLARGSYVAMGVLPSFPGVSWRAHIAVALVSAVLMFINDPKRRKVAPNVPRR